MRSVLTSRRLRWAAPGVVAATVAATALTANVAGATDRPHLPARTAAQLLVAVEQANPGGFSGTIVEHVSLGLPALPGASNDATLSWQSLLTGAHTIRVWYGGPERQRVAVLGQLSESDVVHNGTTLWTYSSITNRVTHSTLDKATEKHAAEQHAGAITPQQAAEQALAAIDPSTAVTVDSTARVAGRPVYQLVLTPRDHRTLVGSVRIAIDSKSSLPLRVQVFGRGHTSPAIEVGFTDVSFRMPDASVFNFVPPAGTKVMQEPLTQTMTRGGGGGFERHASQAAPGQVTAPPAQPRQQHGQPSVIGKGWTAVVKVPGAAAQLNQVAPAMLNRLTTPVAGGRVITSALMTVFITDTGDVYVAALAPADLEKVAATGRAL